MIRVYKTTTGKLVIRPYNPFWQKLSNGRYRFTLPYLIMRDGGWCGKPRWSIYSYKRKAWLQVGFLNA